MDDTFFTRIPKLTDAELFDYVNNHSKYKPEAIEIATTELVKRGHTLPDSQFQEILKNISDENSEKTSRRLLLEGSFCGFGSKHLQVTAILILIIGLGSSIVIYLNADPTSLNPSGYDPLTAKKYLHEMELFGGKLNVLATQFRQWFAGLWYGTSLAYTVAVLSVSLASLLWFFSIRQKAGYSK